MRDGLPSQLQSAQSLESAYEMIRSYPGVGPFLAFQYCIDLNYSTLMNFSEADFCRPRTWGARWDHEVFPQRAFPRSERDHQLDGRTAGRRIHRLHLAFDGLFGRRLQPIDCQNVFCEVSKYARIAHPMCPGSQVAKGSSSATSPRSTPQQTCRSSRRSGALIPAKRSHRVR